MNKPTSPVILASIFPSQICFRETSPPELPLSYKDIGLILSFAILPAPLCRIPL